MNKKIVRRQPVERSHGNGPHHNFSSIGKVASVAIIKDSYSGQSKGFGFVEMETEDGPVKAITKFNGGELSGKKIMVSEAREPRKDGEGGGFNRGGGGGGGRPGGDFGRGGPRRGGGGGGYGGGRYAALSGALHTVQGARAFPVSAERSISPSRPPTAHPRSVTPQPIAHSRQLRARAFGVVVRQRDPSQEQRITATGRCPAAGTASPWLSMDGNGVSAVRRGAWTGQRAAHIQNVSTSTRPRNAGSRPETRFLLADEPRDVRHLQAAPQHAPLPGFGLHPFEPADFQPLGHTLLGQVGHG